LPIPAHYSHFKDRNLLSDVTKDIVGISRDAQHGGLRILIYGEAFLNGGYPAVILVGLVFGAALRLAESLIAWARTCGPWTLLPCVFTFVILGGQVYFSGSAITADAVLGLLTIGLIYWLSWQRESDNQECTA